MKTLKGYIPTMTMFVLLLIGATSANAGVIINSIADNDSDKTSTAVTDGVIINSIVGVIINSITGNYAVAPGIMVSD